MTYETSVDSSLLSHYDLWTSIIALFSAFYAYERLEFLFMLGFTLMNVESCSVCCVLHL
jgi:hypothetical protein